MPQEEAIKRWNEPCQWCLGVDEIDREVDCIESHFLTDSNCIAFEFQFCPSCGRPLTPEAWVILMNRLKG